MIHLAEMGQLVPEFCNMKNAAIGVVAEYDAGFIFPGSSVVRNEFDPHLPENHVGNVAPLGTR